MLVDLCGRQLIGAEEVQSKNEVPVDCRVHIAQLQDIKLICNMSYSLCLCVLAIVYWWQPTLAIQFDSPTRIECSGLESMDVSSIGNCSHFDETNPHLCSFHWGSDCEGIFTFLTDQCYRDEESGNISTVRYLYAPHQNPKCSGNYAQCGDTCKGVDGTLFDEPVEILCPFGSTCTFSALVENYTATIKHPNGSTTYFIKEVGVAAVCDYDCVPIGISSESHKTCYFLGLVAIVLFTLFL